MSRLIRTLTLLLTLSLLLASCLPQTADSGRQTAVQTADSGLQTPTPTETAIPQPSLESLGLSPETRTMLERQGWQITWEYGRIGDSPQPGHYLISQLSWDETYQTFLNETTHEIGYIDTEGNLHTKVTRFSATEHPDGTWTDTSTTQELILPLRSPLPGGEGLGVRVVETKNPAFQKTGILTLTYLDKNGAPQTIFYNQELGFLPKTEISTDLLHPTPLPIEAIHSMAAHQLLILNYGYGEPFPTDGFPGWCIRFRFDEKTNTKRAFLFLDAPVPNGGNATSKFIRFVGEGSDGNVLFPLPKFVIIDKGGNGFISIPVWAFNPQNPQNPQDGNEKLLLFPPLFTGKMTPDQRIEFLKSFPYDNDFIRLFGKQRLIIIATEANPEGDGYFTALYKINDGGWNKVGDRSSLDSLLGMEGNDVGEIPFRAYGNIYHFRDLFQEGFSGAQNSPQKIYERPHADDNPDGTDRYLPLDSELQQLVLVISP